MANEKTSEMNASISRRVRIYIISYAVLMIVALWGGDLLAIMRELLDKERFDIAKSLLGPVMTVAGAAVLMLVNLGRDWDLHNILDRWFFRVRKRTDAIIQTEIMTAAKDVGTHGIDRMAANRQGTMHLFYHFVNEQEQLRSLAFTYWEQYFVNLYNIALCAVGLTISATVVIVRGVGVAGLTAPAIFLALGTLTAFTTFRSLVPKIYELPRQQVAEIKNSGRREFECEIRRRFEV